MPVNNQNNTVHSLTRQQHQTTDHQTTQPAATEPPSKAAWGGGAMKRQPAGHICTPTPSHIHRHDTGQATGRDGGKQAEGGEDEG